MGRHLQRVVLAEVRLWPRRGCQRELVDGLERFGEEGVDAVDLINKMLNPEPQERCVLILHCPSS